MLNNQIRGVSGKKLQNLVLNKTFFMPNRFVNYVDVRDIAKLQVSAIKSNSSSGKRFLCMSSKPISYFDITEIFRQHGYYSPRITLPDFLISFLGLFSKRFSQMSYLLNKRFIVDNSEAKDLLNWEPTSIDTTIADMAASIVSRLEPIE